MSDFKLCCNENGWSVFDDNNAVVSACNDDGMLIGLRDNGQDGLFSVVTYDSSPGSVDVLYKSKSFIMHDMVKTVGKGLFMIQREWTNQSETDSSAFFIFEAVTGFKPAFYLIPCVSYNGNPWGAGGEPKGLEYNGKPWVFPYNRISLPSATFSENDKYSVGVFVSAEDEKSLVSSCSMTDTGSGMLHRIFWPDREEPVAYAGRDTYGKAVEPVIKILAGETFSVVFYINVIKVSVHNYGWTAAFDNALKQVSPKIEMAYQPEKVWELGVSYAKNILWQVRDGHQLFQIGLLPVDSNIVGRTVKTGGGTAEQWKLRETQRFEIGWCGQNAAYANALIYDYLITGNAENFDKGVAVMDTWERCAKLDNGLFCTLFDHLLEGEKQYYMDCCNLGWGAWQMMSGWELVRKAGVNKPQWLDMGLKLCRFFLKNRLSDGSFGKLWDINGICVDEGGTIGCFILLPMIKAYEITGDNSFLDCAAEVFQIYAERDLSAVNCTAGALDTSCIDKETCWPLLKAAIDLYDVTGKDEYLSWARMAAYYLASWMFHYNVIYGENSEFTKYGYHTYGGTAVSTQHHHLDPWGALISCDWLRLYERTGDEVWKKRALAAWANSLLCLSDGKLVIHDRVRPEGSQNEAYFHSRWGFEGDSSDIGRLNDWLVSWPGAFRLVTLMRVGDWESLT